MDFALPDYPSDDDLQFSPHHDYLSGLNSAQRKAVETVDGPVLVLSGAGTGKTRVLTTRLVHLLASGRALPSQILAVTFTNKAAREMRERIGAMMGVPVEGWWLGTFHALGARMLRRHADLVGLNSDFTILDSDDQIRLIKQLMSAANISDKAWPAKTLSGVIQKWKDRGLTPEKLTQSDVGDLANGRMIGLYQQYQDRLRTLNACDFGDLLLHLLTIFQDPRHHDVLSRYHQQFRYIMVDEYQDTNVGQYLWLRLLAQSRKNICCVGDDDQSIYGWRGAEIGNILKFEKDFPGAQTIRLEQNYRSTAPILACASAVIAHNRGRLGKELWTDQKSGEKVQLRGVWDADEEARIIVEDVETRQRRGYALGQMAVLVRAGFQTREFEERLLRVGVPYKVVGGARFYERQEIRDAIAYLRSVHAPADDLAFERIINVPKRGIGPKTIQDLHVAARAENVPMQEAAWRLVQNGNIKGKLGTTIRALLDDLFRWRGLAAQLPQQDLARMVLDESGYTAMWQQDKTPEAPGRLENLKELISAMADFENLGGFLEHVSLVMENQEESGQDAVTLMTLHAAKGLEFDVVYLPGWEEGLFPSQRSLDENGLAGLEEERRLAYVGITRARKVATITYAGSRRVFGQWTTALPSRFIEELPPEWVEAHNIVRTQNRFGGGDDNTFTEYRFSHTSGFVGDARKSPPPPPRARPPVIDGQAYVVKPSVKPAQFRLGQRVFHQKFGYGAVVSVEGDRLEVDFEHTGIKKVMAGFINSV